MPPLPAWPFLLLAMIGILYTIGATLAAGRFLDRPHGAAPAEPVTLLKPLHGAEPRLAENLASFLDQEWAAPIEMVCGVQRADDPARAVIQHLGAPATAGAEGNRSLPFLGPPASAGARRVVEIFDATRHGANAKVSNLVNMAGAASHDLIVLSDSDMAAPRDYLATLATALAEPGVGAATCAYVGRGDAGGWSRVAAGGISYHFIPQLLIGLATGWAEPGMGSTIALRRATLDQIGGFRPFADTLADDYAIGEAVRGLGLTVTVPPMLLVHGCAERTLADVWRHERRWAATILKINPAGQIGTIVTYPVPMALIALPFAPWPAATLLALGLAARLILKRRIDNAAGFEAMSGWLLPLRDCLGFAVFLSAFVARSVDWRGATLTMKPKGRIAARRSD